MCENSPVMAASDDSSPFGEKEPFASSAVWACAVYALVPFVGVVFVPFVFLFGLIAVVNGDGVLRRSALIAMAVGSAVLIGQLVLWWLLYAVPRWSQQGFT